MSEKQEITTGITIDTENENAEDLLVQYTINYSAEERKDFWGLSHDPMLSQKTMAVSIVCIALAIVMFFVRQTVSVSVALAVMGVVWSGVPVLVYWIRFLRYCHTTSNLWLYKWSISLYDGHIEAKRINNTENEPSVIQEYYYDDIYKIINSHNRLYLIAGARAVIIVNKQQTASEILEALLGLDVLIQNGAD